jgi:hypothetical protein
VGFGAFLRRGTEFNEGDIKREEGIEMIEISRNEETKVSIKPGSHEETGPVSAENYFKAEALAKAAFKAKEFGINLDQADKISEGLLDFESSITNQLSAELITGKELNMEKARLLALNGDIAGASAEILRQVGGTAEFSRMNRIQQEAIAKAVGLFNLDSTSKKITVKWSQLQVQGKQKVRDLWRQFDLGIFDIYGCKRDAEPGQFVFAFIPGVGEKPFSVMNDNPLTLGILTRGIFTEKINSFSVQIIIPNITPDYITLIFKIDEILEFLALDSDLHSIKEISITFNISLNVCKDIVNFLAKYNFIYYKDEYLKINPRIRDFIGEASEKSVLQLTHSQ